MRRQPERTLASVIRTHQRVIVATGTMVAMITTVGAPFKWSMRWIPIPLLDS